MLFFKAQSEMMSGLMSCFPRSGDVYRHVQNSAGAGSYSNNQFLYISVITLNATRIYMKKEMKGIQGHTFYQVR